MARAGIYQIPTEIKDQDKWFKYFTKKQAVVLLVTVFMDYRILMWAGAHKALLPALILVIVGTCVAAAIVLIPLPSDLLYLSGGGLMLDQWLLRVWIRKKNKVLYVKNYDGEESE